MALTGPDASRYQGDPDWPAVAAAGHDFAFLKATDGVAYRHVDWFHRNVARVRAAGLVPGAYHFLLDHHHGGAQAEFYVDEVARSGGFHGIVPIVDIEREADGTTPRESHLREFVTEFRRLVPGRPILIYTGRWYWVGVLGNPHGADLGPLWHSEYDGQTPYHAEVADGPELDTYGGWNDCKVWQHTSTGRCPGIAGDCDLNIFYGTRTELLALAGLGPAPTTVPSTSEDDTVHTIQTPGQPVRLVIGGVVIGFPDAGTRDRILDAYRDAGLLGDPVVFDNRADHDLVLDRLIAQHELDAILRAASTTQLGEQMVDVDAIRKNLGVGDENVLRAPLVDIVREALRLAADAG